MPFREVTLEEEAQWGSETEPSRLYTVQRLGEISVATGSTLSAVARVVQMKSKVMPIKNFKARTEVGFRGIV